MVEIAVIAVGGACGAVGRYVISGWAPPPYGTLAVNVLGCFLIGVVMHIGLTTDLLSRNARVLLTTGFLGGLTTFSTFSYETLMAAQDGDWRTAGLNVGLNLVLGLTATWAGFVLARATFGGA